MSYLRLLLLSACIATCYYALTIAAIGIAAARKVFWWLEWNNNFDFYHIAQNFIGIGLAALIPAYLISTYEPARKWLAIGLVIVLSMMLHGNINAAPWDPMGFVRFIEQTLFFGDIGSIGIFTEILLLPILWLIIFEHFSSSVTAPSTRHGST
ncbi:hypothetical protein [Shewanella marisflavi]|uniref:hypothetical protein n=1 Tax=Shewanella marisflavi TaxID=260364 RepID=UPI003AAA9F37